MSKKDSSGFTLIELMIVVAIIGILAAIAYPAYQDQVRKSKRTDGQAALLDMMAKQERYFTDNNSYTATLTGLGYTVDADGNADSPEGDYKLSAAACEGDIGICVLLTATGQGDQANDGGCGTLTINSRNVKSPAACW